MQNHRGQGVSPAVLAATLLISAVAATVGCGSSGEGQIGTAQVGPRPNRGPRATVKNSQTPVAGHPEPRQAQPPRGSGRQSPR
jgi:hypothetical protein